MLGWESQCPNCYLLLEAWGVGWKDCFLPAADSGQAKRPDR